MKKFLSLVFILGILCTVLNARAATITIEANAVKNDNSVTVTGTVSSGANKSVNISLVNPNGQTLYIGETKSDSEGKYELTIPFEGNTVSGAYTVKVSSPAEVTFIYESDNEEIPDTEEPAIITATLTQSGGIITVTGTTSAGSEEEVTLYVENPNGQLAYINQTTSGEGGAFSFTFPLMYNVVEGTYTATIGGTNVAAPYIIKFEYPGDDEEIPDNEEPAIITATLTQNESKITISGNTSGGSEKEITLYVENPNGQLAYINQTTSGEGGAFSFTFPLMYNVVEGTYTATIGGTNVAAPYIIKFEYPGTGEETPEPEEPEEPTVFEITSKAAFENPTMTVSGQIQPAAEVDVRLNIVNSISKVVAETTVKSNESGEYSYVFDLTDKVNNGIYTVNVYVGESSVVTDEVMVIVPLSKSDIDKSKNLRLYTALKKARKNLDSDNDGVITSSELSLIEGALNLSNSSITNIDGLQSCTSITELYINDNKITGLGAIASLDNLQTLVADNNNISKIDVLPENLTYLNISDNSINDLYTVSFVNNIEYLFADRNKISNLEFAEKSANIRYLSINKNSISDISPLENCKNLVYMDLSHNNISDISALSGLNDLKDLRLSYNSISDITSLPDVNYRNLYIDNNDVTSGDIESYNAINKVYLP